MADQELRFITVGEGPAAREIAIRAGTGGAPGLLWLGGFKSDMRGTKAEALASWAAQHHRACVRFDYSGHGESGGEFTTGTIGRWLEETVAVFSSVCRGPQIAVGSSMGGWLALLLARELKRRRVAEASLTGLVLIAPAVDFTEVLMWQRLSDAAKQELAQTGQWLRPSDYADQPYVITRELIEEGRKHLLLGGLVETGCPVRILQGVLDTDVPWSHAVDLVARLAQDDVVITLIKDGDHRLSRPEDIERLLTVVEEL